MKLIPSAWLAIRARSSSYDILSEQKRTRADENGNKRIVTQSVEASNRLTGKEIYHLLWEQNIGDITVFTR
jgi:hypothetical protein